MAYTSHPLRGLVPEWYCPPDQDTGNESEFLLKPLTKPQLLEIELHYDPDLVSQIDGKGIRLAYLYGVKDWRNVIDHKGDPLTFTAKRLDNLDIDLLMHLAGKIIKDANLPDDEVKNS